MKKGLAKRILVSLLTVVMISASVLPMLVSTANVARANENVTNVLTEGVEIDTPNVVKDEMYSDYVKVTFIVNDTETIVKYVKTGDTVTVRSTNSSVGVLVGDAPNGSAVTEDTTIYVKTYNYKDVLNIKKELVNEYGEPDADGYYTLKFTAGAKNMPSIHSATRNDMVLVIDASLSMACSVKGSRATDGNEYMADTYADTRFKAMYNAVDSFLNAFLPEGNDKNTISLVIYNVSALDQLNAIYKKSSTTKKSEVMAALDAVFNEAAFNESFANSPKNEYGVNVDKMTNPGSLASKTNVKAGLDVAADIFVANNNTNAKSIILFTDGVANRPNTAVTTESMTQYAVGGTYTYNETDYTISDIAYKTSYYNENNEEIKAKNDNSPIKIVLFSPFLILGIIGKGIEKLGIKSQTYEKTDNNNISNTISYTKSNNVSLEEKNNIYVKKGNSKKIATNKELKTNDIKVHYKENKQIVNDNNKLENKILLKFGKELERLKNECEIVESEEYILNKYEDDNSIYLKAIDINNKINTLLKKLEKINKEYKLLKNNNLIEEPLLLDDSLLIDDIINYRKILQKEEINKIPKKIKLLEEYKYLYKNLDDLVEKTEKMKEISNKRVQELSARDKKYKDAKNKIVNLEEVENCCNLIIEKNNNYLEELSKKVDKISERKYVESKLKGMNGFLTSSLRYIWLLSLTPLRGILPGIGARTVATRKLLHNMLKNMHYEKQEKIIYSLGNYESEINNKIYDIDSLNYNIDLALEDVQKLKKEFKDYFLSYSFKEYDKAYKKIELIEKNIIDNKNKVYLIKEKLIKSKELNRNTLTKVKKLNVKKASK